MGESGEGSVANVFIFTMRRAWAEKESYRCLTNTIDRRRLDLEKNSATSNDQGRSEKNAGNNNNKKRSQTLLFFFFSSIIFALSDALACMRFLLDSQ